MKLVGGYATCAGNTRNVNQDAVLFRSTEREGQYFILLAVCDGIGGLEQGEVASSLVVSLASQWYESVMSWMDIGGINPEILSAHLKDAAEEWNRSVCEYRNLRHVNMGTTMSLIMIIKNRYYIIHVGDSRVYLYRRRKLLQLTRDAVITQVKDGRRKVYLENFMGRAGELRFTSSEGKVCAGDLFLVCSDGFYHCLHPEDIRKLRRNTRDGWSLNAGCRELTDNMMRRGERDNISVGAIVAGRGMSPWKGRVKCSVIRK